jgi:undecaprenyl-phosphate 4-deoxy-4-formamido-L-arabinose transferase
MNAKRKISIVVPVYNGAATIARLVNEIERELSATNELEMILVNDGSTRDNSDEVCTQLALEKDWVVYIDLFRNFGEHNAVMAGLNHSTGDYVVIMDDDLQNPPSEVIKLIDELDKGFDVVFSKYTTKKHAFYRNLGSSFNNLVSSLVLNKPRNLYLSSFKVVSRPLVEQIIQYDGPFPYVDGLILRTTQRYSTVEAVHLPREVGRSGYTLSKLISLWLNMLTNFSILPLRAATVVGFVLAAVSGVASIAVIVERFINPDLPTGWASVIVVLLFLASVQLVALGLMGEYLGRILLKLNKLPQFSVRKIMRKQTESQL